MQEVSEKRKEYKNYEGTSKIKALADFYHWIKQHLRIQDGLIFSLLNVLRLDNWLCYPESFGWLVHIQLSDFQTHALR